MIAISDITEEGQLLSQKRSLRYFLLIVYKVNICGKPKIAPDFMVAVYCYCLVQLKIVFGPPVPCFDSGKFGALQFVLPAPEMLAEIKTTIFYVTFCLLIYRLALSRSAN